MKEGVEKLRDAIETMHHCAARHLASELVVEIFEGKVAWDGVVETFELAGHPKAKRCHAWSYKEDGETQYVTILEIPPVVGPQSAVQVAIAAQARK